MLSSILSTIIETTFEKEVGRWQSKNEEQKCLDLKFSTMSTNENEIYPKIHLRIFGDCNYIAVLTRKSWTPADLEKDDKHYTPWELLSYHDSCWRSDGVQAFIWKHQDELNTISDVFQKTWYQITTLTIEDIDEIKEIRRRKRGYA